MAQKDLIPLNKRTKDEQKKIQSKGGKASGETRRRKKAMRQAASALLDMRVSVGEPEFMAIIKKRLEAFGYSGDGATYQDALLVGVLLEAIKGDVRAAEFIRDTAGESPSLDIRKEELRLRKEELKLKREQQAGAGTPGAENNLLSAIMGAGEVGTDDLPEVE